MTDQVDDLTERGSVSSGQKGATPLTVFAAPATGSEFNTLGERLVPKGCFKIEDLLFDFDSSFVRPEIATHLPRLAQLRTDHTVGGLTPPLSIFGHADPVGNDVDNKKLSGRRATAIYAMLVRDTDLWETLFSAPVGHDDWGLRAIQTMLSTVQAPIAIDGQPGDGTRKAIKTFQTAHGLGADGVAGPNTRKPLFLAYMDALCGPGLALDKTTDFLARNADGAGGKGDRQGCSEFNPLRLFSKQEAADFEAAADKTGRNRENAPNRRVMILLFAAGRKVKPDIWPCPRTSDGVAGCQKRFFPDAATRRSFQGARREFDTTKDTFACRFYQIISDDSPCERVNPIPIRPEVNPLIILAGQTFRGPRLGITAAPVTAPISGRNFVVVKKAQTKPAREPVILRSDRPFDGTGEFTFVDSGNLRFFADADTLFAMKFDGKDNVFTGDQLTAGVTVFAEGQKVSGAVDDITLTLVLSAKLATIATVARVQLTAIDVTLDIFEPRTDPAIDPRPLDQPPATAPPAAATPKDKVFGGRFVPVQDPQNTQERAMLVVRLRPADFSTTLELTANPGSVAVFADENPNTPGAPLTLPLPIPSSTVPVNGRRFFVQGTTLSPTLRDVQMRIGVQAAEPECDRVSITVVPSLILRTFAPVACPGLDFRIDAVTSAVGTFSWSATGGARFVAGGAAVAVPTTASVRLRSFQPDNARGVLPERKIVVTLIFTSGGIAAPYTRVVTVHGIQFVVNGLTPAAGVTRANEGPDSVTLASPPGGPPTMSATANVLISLASSCPQPAVCAPNYRVGWLQTVFTNTRDIRYSDTLIQVTVTLPIRDVASNISPPPPLPFYGPTATFAANLDAQDVRHSDSPAQGAAWVDPRGDAPTPPAPKAQQLRSVTFSNSFTAWLTIQNLSWNTLDPKTALLFLRNFDWSMQLNVAVDTGPTVGARARPIQNPAVVPAAAGIGQGLRTPKLDAQVAGTSSNTAVNPAAHLP